MAAEREVPGGGNSDLSAEAAAAEGISGRRFLFLTLALAAVLLIAHATPLRDYVSDVQRWKAAVRGHGALGALVFFLAGAAFTAAGLPRLLFAGLAGIIFGFARGSLLALGMGLLGSYGTFVFARWAGRAWAQRRLASRPKLREMVQHPTVASIVLLRQMPLAALIPNLLLGLTNVRHRVFLLGTFLGYLPNTLAAALVGSSLGKKTLAASMTQIAGAMAVLAATAAVLGWWRRKSRE
jgi:uncharacterized membrane protein YdjX (TVP38/TMEM64 family)